MLWVKLVNSAKRKEVKYLVPEHCSRFALLISVDIGLSYFVLIEPRFGLILYSEYVDYFDITIDIFP
jgi:hypothetical protein